MNRSSSISSWGCRHSFTLIELMVVIAIIGVLALILMPALSAVRTTVWRRAATVDAKQIAGAFMAYESDKSAWPVNVDASGYTNVSGYWEETPETVPDVTQDPDTLEWITNYVPTGNILSNWVVNTPDYTPAEFRGILMETNDFFMYRRAVRRMSGHMTGDRIYIPWDPQFLDARTNMVDRWGNIWRVRFDMDGDGMVPNPFEPDTNTKVRASVLVWSPGPDLTNDTAGESSALNKDNIKSW